MATRFASKRINIYPVDLTTDNVLNNAATYLVACRKVIMTRINTRFSLLLASDLMTFFIPDHSLNGYWQIVTRAVMVQLWKFKSIYKLLIEEVCHCHLCTKGCLFSSKLKCMKKNMRKCMQMSFCCFFQCMLCIQRKHKIQI